MGNTYVEFGEVSMRNRSCSNTIEGNTTGSPCTESLELTDPLWQIVVEEDLSTPR